jgi:hypothetical protein
VSSRLPASHPDCRAVLIQIVALQQIGHRQTWAMLGQQARHLKTAAAIASVAGHLQHREMGSNLTEQDDTSGHGADPR